MGLFFRTTKTPSNSKQSGEKLKTTRSVFDYVPIGRWFGPVISIGGVCTALFFVLTGRVDLSKLDQLSGGEAELTAGATSIPVDPIAISQLGARSLETIRIASFNIQMFGQKKSTSRMIPEVPGVDILGTIAQIVSQFDLIAIQEVRGGDGTPVQRLVDLLNASGLRYTAVVSEPIGRTSQTECYAFVWDETRIQWAQGSAYVVQDAADRMHREPMVSTFRALVDPRSGRAPFSFTIINAHTDPDEVTVKATSNEINVLDDVFVRVRQYEYDQRGEEDCILVGDLNVDANSLQELALIPNVFSIAGDLKTNTRRTATYDHILIDREMTREYTGRFGVIDFERDLGLSVEQALAVSDHMALWAEFSAYEAQQPPIIAAGPSAAFQN